MKRSFLVLLGLLGALLSAYLAISTLNRQLMPVPSVDTMESSMNSSMSNESPSLSSSTLIQGQAASGRKTILIDPDSSERSSSSAVSEVQL